MRTRLAVALTVVLLLAGRASLRADQNLLANPGFSTSLSGWQPVTTVPSGSVAWDGTLDADGSSRSGSARGVFSADAVAGLVPVLTQCVPLKFGATYVLGGEIFIPEGNTADGSAFLGVVVYSSPDCSGFPPPSFSKTPQVTAVGQWTEVSTTFNALRGSSALVYLFIAPNTPGTFTANFDNLIVAEGRPCHSDSNRTCLNGD